MTEIRIWIKRIVLLLMGLTIAHLGVTLFLLADLGSDPFNVLIQGLYRFLPWPGFMTHGYVHMGVSFLIILALLAVDRSYIRIGTLLCMVLGGPIIDVFTMALGGPDPFGISHGVAPCRAGGGLRDSGLRYDHRDPVQSGHRPQ